MTTMNKEIPVELRKQFEQEARDMFAVPKEGGFYSFPTNQNELKYYQQQAYLAARIKAWEEGMELWEFIYSECIHESAAATISIHKSEEGAMKALAFHKEEKRKEWQRMVDSDEDKGTELSYGKMCPFGEFEFWGVNKIKVLP